MKILIALQRKLQNSARYWILFGLVVIQPGMGFGELRTWTNREGRSIEADYRGLKGEVVEMILRNGRLAEVPLASLSDADQDWVRKAEGAAATPEMEVEKPVVPRPENPPKPPAAPKEKLIDWGELTDLGDRVPDFPPIPEPDPEALIAVDDWIGGRYFYMRPDGTDAFPHLEIKSRIKPFAEGLAWVKTETTEGYIDREGKFVIGGDSELALPEGGGYYSPFSGGLAEFSANGFCGYLGKNGKVVIPADKFRHGEDFSGGLAAVNDSAELGKATWRYINKVGEIVIPGPWPGVRPFRDGVAWVAIDDSYNGGPYSGRYRLIDSEGKPVLGDATFKSHETETMFSGGFCRTGDKVIRSDGTVFLEDTKDVYVTNFSDDGVFAAASIRGGAGFRLAHLPSKSVYGPRIKGHALVPFREGLMPVSVRQGKNRYICVDRSGEVVIGDGYFDPPEFWDGFAVVRRAYGEDEEDIRIVVINRKGEVVWKGEGRS